MEYLRQVGRQALESFGQILEYPEVTGLLVETDPMLRLLWRIRTTMASDDWDSLDSQLAQSPLIDWTRLWGVAPDSLRAALGSLLDDTPPQQRPLPCNPDWPCRTFDAIRRAPGRLKGREGPAVVFTVLYDPLIGSDGFEGLAAAAGEVPWRVRLASRPVASAQAGPRDRHDPLVGGISMGGAGHRMRGTLGGFLVFDDNSYAVTCGHVIGESSQAVQPSDPDGGSEVIGTCVHSTAGSLTDPRQACHKTGPANEVDAALVRIDVPVAVPRSVRNVGPILRTVAAKDVVEGEIVRLSARSGTRSLEVGALALRRSIGIRGTTYCFQNLLELRRPGPNWGQKGSIKPPSKDGDSGAWVLRPETDGCGWIGMLTAGDGPSSYAQFAETVEKWAGTRTAEEKARAEAERQVREGAEMVAKKQRRLKIEASKRNPKDPR